MSASNRKSRYLDSTLLFLKSPSLPLCTSTSCHFSSLPSAQVGTAVVEYHSFEQVIVVVSPPPYAISPFNTSLKQHYNNRAGRIYGAREKIEKGRRDLEVLMPSSVYLLSHPSHFVESAYEFSSLLLSTHINLSHLSPAAPMLPSSPS